MAAGAQRPWPEQYTGAGAPTPDPLPGAGIRPGHTRSLQDTPALPSKQVHVPGPPPAPTAHRPWPEQGIGGEPPDGHVAPPSSPDHVGSAGAASDAAATGAVSQINRAADSSSMLLYNIGESPSWQFQNAAWGKMRKAKKKKKKKKTKKKKRSLAAAASSTAAASGAAGGGGGAGQSVFLFSVSLTQTQSQPQTLSLEVSVF